MDQIAAIDRVVDERRRQDEKWGPQAHGHEVWLTILTEEVGEVAEAILDYRFKPSPETRAHLLEELVQVTAVGVSWLEQGDWS
jgi:NTP pyrophosphatase (non-canonical NTP hydrolase)